MLTYAYYNCIYNEARMIEVIGKWLVDIGMALGPILGYVSQYRLIRENKSVGSFSIDICGILLFANILRLNFYIFKQYETALVFQSLFMVTMQVILLRECTKYPISTDSSSEEAQASSEEVQPTLPESKVECRQNIEKFWRWNGFQKFGVTILFFTFCTFALSGILKLTPLASGYGELVGLIALMSESILIAPQIIRNIQKQSTKGLSRMLVTFNLSGDIFKLIYFLANSQPFQFIMCGVIQVILDSFVIIQIFYYTSKEARVRREASHREPPIKISDEILESENNLNIDQVKQLQSDRQNKLPKQIHVKKASSAPQPVQLEQNYEELQEQIHSQDEDDKQQKDEKHIKGTTIQQRNNSAATQQVKDNQKNSVNKVQQLQNYQKVAQ